MKHPKIISTTNLLTKIMFGGEKLVFTNGCYDLFHAGHASLLSQIKAEFPDGYKIIVGVNSDKSVKLNKGPERPIIPEEQRAFVVACHEAVDYVFVFNEPTVDGYLRWLKPDYWVKGGDYSVGTLHPAEKEACGDHTQVMFIPLVDGISATKIVERIAK